MKDHCLNFLIIEVDEAEEEKTAASAETAPAAKEGDDVRACNSSAKKTPLKSGKHAMICSLIS